MNGSSSSASPSDSGMKKRLSPTFNASEIFSSVPRLGVICPLSMRDRYERETFDRHCNWLCVIDRASRSWRMRWPIFSTVSRFANFSLAVSALASSDGAAVGIMNSSRWGSARTQRRQLPVRVRYCTNPQVLQRITSRSISNESHVSFSSCRDTRCSSLTLSGVRIGEERRNVLRGEGSNWRDGEYLSPPRMCQEDFLIFFRQSTAFLPVSACFSPVRTNRRNH